MRTHQEKRRIMKHFDLITEALALLYARLHWEFHLNIEDEARFAHQLQTNPKQTGRFQELLAGFDDEYSDVLPRDVLSKVSVENGPENIIAFLREYDRKKELDDGIALSEFQTIASEFGQEAAECLLEVCDLMLWNPLPLACDLNGNLRISCGNGVSYDKFLRFIHAQVVGPTQFRLVRGAELSKGDGGYLLELAVESPVGCEVFAIAFQRVEMGIECYNYTGFGSSMAHDDTQWITLANFLEGLKGKYEGLGDRCLTQDEKALLPLAGFLPIMMFLGSLGPMQTDVRGIDVFEKYAREQGNRDILPLLAKLRQCEDEKSGKRISKRIQTILRHGDNEPVWRAIYNDLRVAASIYPSLAGAKEEEIVATRSEVAEALLRQGFQGEYPCFKKLGRLKGVRLLENRLNTYLVGNEKHMGSYVFCEEVEPYDGKLLVNYICGTILFRNEELERFDHCDAYSAFFLDKGRRFGSVVKPKYPDYINDQPVYVPDDEVAMVAAKTATLQKLSKEEREKVLRLDHTNVFATLAMFTLLGTLLFGLCMTLGFVLISFVLGLLFTQSLQETLGAIVQVPWQYVFLGTGLPYGLIMGTITVFAKRSK